MLIKLNSINNSKVLINSEDISYVIEEEKNDEFYQKSTKYCMIVFKNGTKVDVEHTLEEIDYKLTPDEKQSVTNTKSEELEIDSFKIQDTYYPW